MEKLDLQLLIDIRSHIIAVYNFLEARNEPSALIKQSDIAREIELIIPKIDKILKNNNVNFK